MSSLDTTPTDTERLPVDLNLVAPETRYELLDGVLTYVAPALEPHGTRHAKLSALVEAHAGAEFTVACDMLTRTGRSNEFAPDVSVFPSARDPVTGGRQLEHLAFELVSTQTLGGAGEKAAKLVARGVRRVFAIDVGRARALEWSAELGTWSMLDPRSSLADPALAVPLPIGALLSTAKSDDDVARALLLKHNAVLEAAVAEGKREGLEEGKRTGLEEGKRTGRCAAVLDVLSARGIALTAGERARIVDERDPERLSRWIALATTCSTAHELFAAR